MVVTVWIHNISIHLIRNFCERVDNTVGGAVAVADSIGWVMLMHEQALETSFSEYWETYVGSGSATASRLTNSNPSVPGSTPKTALPSSGIRMPSSSSRLSIFGY